MFSVKFRENPQSALEPARVTSGVCTCCIGESARVTSGGCKYPYFSRELTAEQHEGDVGTTHSRPDKVQEPLWQGLRRLLATVRVSPNNRAR